MGRPAGDGSEATRLPVTAYIGTTVWQRFHIDPVGESLRMTGQPDDVLALARVAMPDLEQHGYRAYPLVDHIADKIAATVQRYGQIQAPSAGYKEMVDLVAIITGATVDAEAQQAALHSEAQRRAFTLPTQFAVPDRALWETGYRAEARRSLLPIAHTLDEALHVVRPFAAPLLDGTVRGQWHPTLGRWTT